MNPEIGFGVSRWCVNLFHQTYGFGRINPFEVFDAKKHCEGGKARKISTGYVVMWRLTSCFELFVHIFY